MTAAYFETLTKRDFENGAIRDSIYYSLKKLESLQENTPRINDLVAAVKAIDDSVHEEPSEDSWRDNFQRNLLALGKLVTAARAFVDSLEKVEAKCEECERLRDLLRDAQCRHCEGQGWYVVANRHTGEPEQEQCRWCAEREAALAAPAKATEARE